MQVLLERQTVAPETITVEGLSYAHRGQEVFRDFSLKAKGRTVILRGPSGCGKTTLLKLLSGNLKSGHFIKMPATEKSCLVLQEDSLFPWLTGIENIGVLTKISPKIFKNHPMFELIAGFVGQKACRMSYGQRRLVELFRAIVFQPGYLYLDEPFNFLDEVRISMVLPFLQSDFLKNTNLTLSNHHRQDLARLGPASIFQFDGLFPITQLRELDQ